MLTRLYNLIYRLATWPVVALLFIAYILSNQGFVWRQTKLDSQLHLLDTRFLYSPADAQNLFEILGHRGRAIYAITELSLDFMFPFIYGLLLAIFLVRLYSGHAGKLLIILPLLTMSADLLENATVAYLALSFGGKTSAFAWASTVFTATKWMSFLVCFLIILKGGLAGLWKLQQGTAIETREIPS